MSVLQAKVSLAIFHYGLEKCLYACLFPSFSRGHGSQNVLSSFLKSFPPYFPEINWTMIQFERVHNIKSPVFRFFGLIWWNSYSDPSPLIFCIISSVLQIDQEPRFVLRESYAKCRIVEVIFYFICI